MALRRRAGERRGEASLTACPFCEVSIAEQASFADHWPGCPDNPATGGER